MTFLLTTIGFIIGFSQKIIAQYGAPMVQFFLKGKVFAQNTNKPIPNIYIAQHFGQEAKTNENGEFLTPVYVDWGAKLEFFANDVDGELNGEFATKFISLEKYDEFHDTLNMEIYLQEKQKIEDLIAKNNLPEEFEGKRIIYKEIKYLTEAPGNVFVDDNNKEVPQIKAYINFKEIPTEIINNDKSTFKLTISDKINVLFIDNINNDENKLYYLSLPSLHYNDNHTVTLAQTPETIEAIIIMLIEK